MTMQIKTISLYGKNRERRDIDFNLGSVNIITGSSRTGKTSLIDIVSYCLGDQECTIKAGYIPETVDWYSILLQLNDTEVFIARAAPLQGANSSETAHMLVAESITIPSRAELKNDNNIRDVIEFLSHKLIKSEPTEGDEQLMSIHQARYYLFQSQTEISNNEILFHHQAKPNAAKEIKDTLPYFIGAHEHNHFQNLRTLKSKKKERAGLISERKQIETLKGRALKDGYSLLTEAASIGLYTSPDLIPEEKTLMDELRKISQSSSYRIEEDEKTDNSDLLSRLENTLGELKKKRDIINLRIEEANDYNDSADGFYKAIETQSFRLRSIGLFEKTQKTENCPICETPDMGISKVESTINKALLNLDEKLNNVNRRKPKVNDYLEKLKTERSKINTERSILRKSIKELLDTDLELAKRGKEELLRSRVSGMCYQFLRNTNWGGDTAAHDNRIKSLDDEIDALSKSIDPKALKKRLNEKLTSISEDMTKWARELNLEHSEGYVRLDPIKLTVVIDKPNETLPLSNIGSRENWLGYHLVTYFALAKWFIEQSRPVGNFLFLDQPSQVLFPNSSAITGDLSEIPTDKDRESVKALFNWIFEIVKSLSPDLQVIITDHADIDEPWFQEAVINPKWRGDHALIPKNWY